MRDPLLLPERIRMLQDELSTGQRRVARFFLSQPRSAGELTAARIGRMVGVSESTVVRLALRLGYDGFPELQEAIGQSLKRADGSRPGTTPSASFANTMIAADQRNVEETVRKLDLAEVARAVEILSGTRTIYVVGFRTSFSIAYLASFLLQQIHPQTRLMDDSGGSLANEVLAIGANDTVIAIALPRYVRKTVQVVEFAMAQGAKTIAITDSFLSPIATADVVFSVTHDAPSFFNSNVGATMVVNAIVGEYAERTAGKSPRDHRQLVESFYELIEGDAVARNGRRS